MTAIGETLRRERIRRNLDLETISGELKISAKFLEAIEEEKFDRLPGGVFAKAFVRQYAHLLGLDEEEMANEVQRTLQPATAVTQSAEVSKLVAAPIPLPKVEAWDSVGESRFEWSSPLTALALVRVVMMGCAGVYSWWQRTRRTVSAHDSGAAKQMAQQVTPQNAPPVPAPVPDQSPANAAPAPAAETPAPAQTPAEPAAANAVVTPASTAPAPSNPNAPVRVELVAAEPVWVLVPTPLATTTV